MACIYPFPSSLYCISYVICIFELYFHIVIFLLYCTNMVLYPCVLVMCLIAYCIVCNVIVILLFDFHCISHHVSISHFVCTQSTHITHYTAYAFLRAKKHLLAIVCNSMWLTFPILLLSYISLSIICEIVDIQST